MVKGFMPSADEAAGMAQTSPEARGTDRGGESPELTEEEVEATLEDADIQTNTVSQWRFSISEKIAEWRSGDSDSR